MAHRARHLVAALALGLLAFGCAQGADEGTESTPAPAASPSSSEDLQQNRLAFVSSSLGEILTIEGVGTLYVFSKDTGEVSACTATCATTWPPLVVGDGLGYGPGVDRAKVGTIGREGAEQVTYDGKPLYQYSGDASPADHKGQGVGGSWYVLGQDGEPIKTAA